MKMMLPTSSFLLVVVVLAVVSAKAPPTFGPDYFLSGRLRLPYGEISEPIQAWISRTDRKSRIDYYGGTMKTIQREDTGMSYKINPMTTDSILNQIHCFKIYDGGRIQNMIPDLGHFKYVGEEKMNGVTVDKWENTTSAGQHGINTYTFYATQGANPVPVRYDMRGFDSLLGSHFDHYVIDYDKFMQGKPDPSVFEPEGVKPPPVNGCHDFPGPGLVDVHLETHSHHNPMAEFVDGNEEHVHRLFKGFVKRHGRDYVDDKAFAEGKNAFRHNLRYIHSKNRAGLNFTLAVNHFADQSPKQRLLLRGLKRTPGYHGGETYQPPNAVVPDQWDWRIPGAVTQVKDQAVCGSCWSFGTTGTIEGRIFVKTGARVRLSQQYLVDCSWGQGNDGCDGGEDFRSYKYIIKHGIALEKDYGRYLGINGMCKGNYSSPYTITGWSKIPPGNLGALKVAIFKEGPISVGIDASHPSFSFYNSGVYYEPKCSSEDLDHAVLAVGYGELHGQKYWLVKNSWSTYWGNDGYVLMSQKDNNCGVASSATFVHLK